MSNLCHECGQKPSEGHRRWCGNYHPAVVYHNTTPRARNTDPTTSHQAAATVTGVTETQQRILEAYRANGAMSDEELCQRLAVTTQQPVSVSGIRTRRCELVEAGEVYDTGETRPTATGRAAIVWDIRK